MSMMLRKDPAPPALPEIVRAVPRCETGFFSRVPGCLAFPLRSSGLLQLLLGSLLLWMGVLAIRFGGRGIVLTGTLMGYFATYLLDVANEAGDGKDGMPHWPGLTPGLAANFGMLLLTVVLSLVPVIFYAAAMYFYAAPVRLAILPIYASLVFMPMALLRVSMMQTLEAIHPIHVVRSMIRVATPYLGLCLVLTALGASYVLLESVLARVPYAGSFLGVLAGLYFALVGMRLLGLFYFVHRRHLDWFSGISGSA